MSAENRAMRKAQAGLYKDLPTRDQFTAATEYERTKQQAVSSIDSAVIQRAQAALAVLSNPEVSKALPREKFDHLAKDAADFTAALLKQGIALMKERDKMAAEEEDEDEAPDTLHAV
jgi:hypothetical protein